MNVFGQKNKNGFTIVEVLTTLVIASVVIAGAVKMFSDASLGFLRQTSVVKRNIENMQMLKMMSEPVYFGQLASFPDNDALKKCIAADGNLCHVDVDYPMKAYDLTTLGVLETQVGSAENYQNEFSFRVHCSNHQASCDQADYFIVKVKTTAVRNGQNLTLEKSTFVRPEMSNVLTFTPDTTVTPGRPINVIIFLDNSNSMLYIKDKLKAGLTSLVNRLSTMNVRIAIYDLGFASSGSYTINKYRLDGSGNRIPYDSSLTTPFYIEYDFDLPFSNEYSTNLNYLPNPQRVQFSSDDTTAIRDIKLTLLRNIIDGFFMNNNFDFSDMPLCKMAAFLHQTTQAYSLDPFTPNIFMVISNENDESALPTNNTWSWYTNFSLPSYNQCIKKLHADGTPGRKVDVKFKTQILKYDYDLTTFVDGAPKQKSLFNYTYSLSGYDPGRVVGAACNPAEEQLVLGNIQVMHPNPTDSYVLKKCTHAEGTLTYGEAKDCIEGEVLRQKAPWNTIPGTCHEVKLLVDLYSMSNYTFEPRFPIDSEYAKNSDFVGAIAERLQNLNILKNTYFFPIIHKTSELASCPLTPGAQAGARYEGLVNALGANGEAISICSADYGAKLEELASQQLEAVAISDIQLPPNVAGMSLAVEVLRDGQVLKPIENVDYIINGLSLVFTANYLKKTDSVKVYLK